MPLRASVFGVDPALVESWLDGRPRSRKLWPVVSLVAAVLLSGCPEDATEPAEASKRAIPVDARSDEVSVHPLPSLDIVVDRLRAEQWRIEAPGALQRARQIYDLPSPPTLQQNVTAESQVRAAIGRLSDALRTAPSLRPHLASTLERADSITILLDEEPGAQLRYDSLHDSLKVPRCALSFPPPLLAVAISHELLHAADHDQIARDLGLDREAVGLLQDLIGPEHLARERTRVEERAIVFELQVARAFRIPIRRPPHPPRRVPGCYMTAEGLLHVLAGVAEAEAGPPGTLTRAIQSAPGTR